MKTRVIRSSLRRESKDTSREGSAPARPGRHYFVGRKRDLEDLYDAVHQATVSETLQVVSLSAPAGAGKTRLVHEVLGLLADKPLAIYAFQLADPAAPPVLAAMLRQRFGIKDATRSAREQLDAIQLGLSGLVGPSRLDDATRLLAAQIGVTVGSDGAPLPGFDPGLIRSERFRERAEKTALNLLRFDMKARPHLFVFDDWDRAARPADLATIERLLAFVAGHKACAFVLSRRPLEPLLDPPAPAVARAHSLDPLAEPDTRRLLEGLLEEVEDLPPEILDNAVSTAAGNPAMAEELVALLLSRGAVKSMSLGLPGRKLRWYYDDPDDDDPDNRTQTLPLPQNVGDSVRERLESLDGAERAVIQAASVFGEVFWRRGVVSLRRGLLGEGASGDGLGADPLREEVNATLERLTERGLLKGVQPHLLPGEPALSFAQDRFQAVTYDTIGSADQRQLHRLAAQWLAQRQTGDAVLWREMRAAHLGAGAVPREAARLYLEAGQLARGHNAPARAIQLLRHGVSLVGDDSAALARDLLAALAQTHIEASDFDEAHRCLDGGRRFARLLDDVSSEAAGTLLLAEISGSRGQYQAAHAQIEYALSQFTHVEDLAGTADAKEALARLLTQRGDTDALQTAQEHLKQALRLRRRLKAPLRTAQTLSALANVKYSSGDLGGAIDMHEQARSIRQRHGDKRGLLVTLNGLGAARYDNGEHDEAVALWEAALSLSDDVGDRTQRTVLLMNLGEQRLESGHLTEAHQSLSEAIAITAELGLVRLQALAQTLMSALMLARGEESQALKEAECALESGRAIDSRPVVGHALLAKARALSNALFVASADGEARQREATDCFRQAIAILEEMGEKPTLAKALNAYGVFLVERGVKGDGRAHIERAAALRRDMRGTEQEARAFHQARTIRREYQTGPVQGRDLNIIMDMVKRPRKPEL